MFRRFLITGLIIAELYLTEGQISVPESSITLLLSRTFRENVTVDFGVKDCSEVFFNTELLYIAKVNKTATYKLGSALNCEIEIYGTGLGRTTVWSNINCSKNCISLSKTIVHVTVERSLILGWISYACGWIYFSAWTMSFYPQIYDNWKRKSVIGFNFDFVTLNQLGYVCYSMFNIGLYYIPTIENQYFEKHPGATNPVQLNDVVFSVHGFIGTAYMILQVFMYERGGQTMSKTGVVLLGTLFLTLGIIITGAVVNIVTWLEALYYCSYIKLVVTVTKYIPQAVMNYRLKSTVGWSIGAVFCDSVGSVFSILQMVVISYNRNDWVSIMGDPTKFGLGAFSACFDIIFLVQHFILYRHNEPLQEKTKPSATNIKDQPYTVPV